MDNFSEAIMGHIKKIQSLNPEQISLIEDRFDQIVSQFHTPNHPPYAAMIQSAILELNEKGGSTEKSISEFINRRYDDLPWAHCSLLKHHLGLLSEHGEIIVTRGCRYSICGAGSKSSSMKGGKKHRRKKWRWRFEKKQNKKVKLKTMVRSKNENEFEEPSQVKDENALVAGNAVIETECPKDGLQTPRQDGTVGTVLLQLTDGRENDICGKTKAMDIDPPFQLVADGCENRMGIEQKQETCQLKLHELCDLHSMELHLQNPNGDAIQELGSPERPPGFEFVGVETRNSQDCLIDSHQLHMSKLIATETHLLPAPTISSPTSEKKDQHRNPPPKLVVEHLEKDDLPCSLFPMQEKKKGKHRERRQFDQMLGKREILLALPDPQKGFPLLRDRPMQVERPRRRLRRWSVDLPVISHMKKVSSSTENSGKYPPVEVTSDIEEPLQKVPSESTAITRRVKVNSSQRESGGQLQPMSVSPCSSANLQQDEGSISQGVCQLMEFPQQEKEMPLRIYRRRRRSSKAKIDTIVQDELPLADIQQQREEEPPFSKKRTSVAALTKEELLMPPNHEDHSVKKHKVELSKPRPRGKPSNRKLVISKGEDDQPFTRSKLKKSF